MSILTKPPSQKPDKPRKPGKPEKVKKQKASKPPKGEKPAKGEAKPTGRRRASITHASVNLLSPWVLEEIHVRKLRLRFVLGALVLLLLLAAAWGALRMNLASSEEDLRGESAVADGLNAQISEMGDVQTYVGDVTVRTTKVEETMADEVAYSTVLRTLDEALPDGASYEAITLTLAPDSGPAAADSGSPDDPVCPGPDPFGARVTVGCIVLSGTADDRDDVSALVQALDESNLFVEPFIDATTTDAGDGPRVTTFSGSLGLDPATFSHRYADIDGSEDDAKKQESTP